jgi:hypothetical protein
MIFDKFDLSKLDRQMMKDIDSMGKGVVWMRDDYLSMRGMAFCSDRKLYDLLGKVELLRDELINEGYVFNCDKHM